MAPPSEPASPFGPLLRRRSDGGRDWLWIGRTGDFTANPDIPPEVASFGILVEHGADFLMGEGGDILILEAGHAT